MNKKPLIIVESPAKIKTLKKFLGAKYHFASSVGHIRDLPEKEFGIDVEHNFEPKYINLPNKKDVIKNLKDLAKKSDTIYLCPDPDREGEAIAWHISQILPKTAKIKRVTFHSITKNAVVNGLENPRKIDLPLVNAQQARRLLDRIVGYKISPILSRIIKRGKGTSAGRVQSVALKLVVDREIEIRNFKTIEYWKITAKLNTDKKDNPFEAHIYSVDGKKVEKEKLDKKSVFLISNEEIAKKIEDKLKKAKFKVGKVEKKEKKRHPTAPFITSTLQQEASRHFGFAANRTMGIAQGLYEGIDLKDRGFEGLITYMRTDSVNIAKEAIFEVRDFIEKKYGKTYLPETPVFYKSKKAAQEAHEAIRPTNLANTPESIQKFLTLDQFKLYNLIWNRFVASQMKSAIYDTVSCDIETDKDIVFRATGSNIKFQGFLKVYVEKKDLSEEEEKDKLLPNLETGKALHLLDLIKEQSFTKPPSRYSEASLVKDLEKSGIGRPSTYVPIMNKIQSREYTTKEKYTLKPTELGELIIKLMDDNFAPIVNVGFTAAMEDDLELVAEDKRDWKGLIKEFYKGFIPMVEKAAKEATVPKIDTDKKCPKCKKNLQKIWSKNKYFYGCSDYPDCDYTCAIDIFDLNKQDYDENFDWDQKCPKCKGPTNLRSGRFGIFLGCTNYPTCSGIINVPKKGEQFLQPKDRPNCPALGCDGKIVMRKSRRGKTFFSCSNFPDCNVIVNALDELEKKYDANYPKTPYTKSARTKDNKQLYEVSKDLEKIVEEKELGRGEIIKRIWKYIKEKKLQDPKNKRTIIPDKNLKKIFDKPIDMMQLAKHLKNHIKRK